MWHYWGYDTEGNIILEANLAFDDLNTGVVEAILTTACKDIRINKIVIERSKGE